MNVLSLFDGMSCGQIALEKAGINVNKYYAAELDKHAITVAKANYPSTIQLGDVTEWREWDIDWASIDLLIGGSPCQGFSFAGKQLAFDDPRSKLFFVYVDILNHIRSLNPDVKFLLENVKMKKEFLDIISNQLFELPIFIDSVDFTPMRRQRYYWCNWDVSEWKPKEHDLSLMPDWDSSFRPATVKRTKEGNFLYFTDKNHFNTITATYVGNVNGIGRPALAKREFEFKNKFPYHTGESKPLSPRQCEWLQAVPDGYTSHVSNAQRYKMLGNGWTVDVVAHIFNSI